MISRAILEVIETGRAAPWALFCFDTLGVKIFVIFILLKQVKNEDFYVLLLIE